MAGKMRTDPETGLTDREEKFCQEMVLHSSMTKAYRASYSTENMKDVSVRSAAHRVTKRPLVEKRIAQLKAEMAERYEVTQESLLAELEEARQMALRAKQSSSAVAATMGKARLVGMDKQIMSNDPENPLPSLIQIEVVRP